MVIRRRRRVLSALQIEPGARGPRRAMALAGALTALLLLPAAALAAGNSTSVDLTGGSLAWTTTPSASDFALAGPQAVVRYADVGPFVPGTAITYHVPWRGTPVQGTYQVTGRLTPSRGPAVSFRRTVTFGGEAIEQFRRETGRAAEQSGGPPVLLVGLLAIATLAALGLGIGYLRMRRQVTTSSPGYGR